jgi:hypothetical protein
MPYNGLGTATLVYNWDTDAANGILVSSGRMDTQEADIADMLTNCITRDGQSPATYNIPMAGYRITGLGTGVVSTDAVNYAQVFVAPSFTGGITVSGGIALTGTSTLTGSIDASGATYFKVPTATAGDSSTNAASTAFVASVAFSSALPAISAATKGRYITNNASVSSWGVIPTSYSAVATNGGF